MIKCVIHCSDIHIRTFMRLDEYQEQLSKFIEQCAKIASKYDKDEVRIVISGDIVHNKNQISSEQISMTSSFIRKLQSIAKVIVIAGNHDMIVSNQSRMDSLTGIFQTAGFENAYYLDNMLEYESGIVVEDNITWALYSIFDEYRRPDIEAAKEQNPDNVVIGLYHGSVVGATLNNGIVMESGLNADAFTGCDVVMAGDIHKRQEIKRGDVRIVYPGSLIQQTMGETITQHGFVVWDISKLTYKTVDIPSDYGLYSFEIKSVDDIDDDKEKLINF